MVRGDNIAMVGVHVKQNTGTPLMYTTQGHCHFVTPFLWLQNESTINIKAQNTIQACMVKALHIYIQSSANSSQQYNGL